MKKLLSIVLAIAVLFTLCVGFGANAEVKNLIPFDDESGLKINHSAYMPDFSPDGAYGVPAWGSWIGYDKPHEGWTYDENIYFDSETYKYGTKSLILKPANKNMRNIMVGVYFDSSILEAGKTYTFQAYVKTNKVMGDLGTAVRVNIMNYDQQPVPGAEVTSQFLLGTNAWTLLSVTFTMPKLEKSAVVQLICLAGSIMNGTSWFDGLALVEGAEAIDYEKLSAVEGPKKPVELNGEPSAWAKEEILKALEADLVPAHVNSNYTTDITRSDFCDLIIKMIEKKSGKAIADVIAGYADAKSDVCFPDTDSANVIAAAKLGIVNGRSSGAFDPTANITRQEAAKMLALAAKVLGADITASEVAFADADDIYAWAKEFIYYVNTIGVMNGTSTTTPPNFSPLRTYTREQSILTVYRLFNAISTPTETQAPTMTETPMPTETPKGEDGVYNVNDFKGKGSGAIQNAIDACPEGGTVYIPAGTYQMFTSVTLKSGITIKGDGAETVLLADEMITISDKSGTLMKNGNVPSETDVFGDCNITIEGITFDGARLDSRTGSLLSFTKAQNITIKDCTFKNNVYISLGLGGCKDVTVIGCTFENNGLPKPSKTSTPALWTDKSGDTFAQNIIVEDCTFRNNNWSGCYFMPHGGRIARCTFIDNGESTIFTNDNARDIEYIDNYITGARKSNISCSGIEIGGVNIRVEGNLIENCGAEGISLTNTENVVVRNNMILNNGQETDSGHGICLYSLKGTAGDFEIDHNSVSPKNILIENNFFGNTDKYTVSQFDALGAWRNTDGDLIADIRFVGNTMAENNHYEIHCIGNGRYGTLAEDCKFENNTETEITPQMRQEFFDELNKRMEADK